MIHELCIFRACFYILVEILIVHVLLHMWLMNDCRKSSSKMCHHVFKWRSTICRIFCEVFLEMKVFRKEWIEIYRGRIWDDKMNFFMIVDWDSIGSASRSQCSFCLSHHFMEKLIYFDKICQQHFGGYWWAVIYFCQAGVLTDVLGHWTRDSGGQRLFNLSGDRLTHTSHACLLLLSMSWI